MTVTRADDTAGLGYVISATNPVDRMYRQTGVLNPGKPLQNMIDGLAKMPLLAQPGTRWYYSIAVDVQGYLIEKFSGMSFGDFAEQRIFAPLGMKDTAFYVPADKLSRLALVHVQDGAGKLLPPDDGRGDPTVVPLGPSGGGGLFSTASTTLCEMLLEADSSTASTCSRREPSNDADQPCHARAAQDDARRHRARLFRVWAAEAGEPVSGAIAYGIAGTWF